MSTKYVKSIPRKIMDVLSPIPLDTVDPSYISSTELKDQMLKAGLGWFGLMSAIRLAAGTFDRSSSSKRLASLKSNVNATNPIFSPDTSLEDTEEERAERQVGTELDEANKLQLVKSAEEEPQELTAAGGILASLRKAVPSSAYPALAAAAVLGSGVAGWKLADRLSDKWKTNRLNKDIDAKRNELDNLVLQEYERTRSQKTASRGDGKEGIGLWDWVKSLGRSEKPGGRSGLSVPGAMETTKKLYALYAAAALYVGYAGTKSYMDNRAPNNIREAKLSEVMKERKKAKGGLEFAVPSKFQFIPSKPNSRSLASVELSSRTEKADTDLEETKKYSDLLAA